MSCRLLEHFLLHHNHQKYLFHFFLNIPLYIYIWGFGHFNSFKSPLEVGYIIVLKEKRWLGDIRWQLRYQKLFKWSDSICHYWFLSKSAAHALGASAQWRGLLKDAINLALIHPQLGWLHPVTVTAPFIHSSAGVHHSEEALRPHDRALSLLLLFGCEGWKFFRRCRFREVGAPLSAEIPDQNKVAKSIVVIFK